MKDLLIVFPLVVLIGLCFVMFIGRRRRKADGVMAAPAPGSRESPIFGSPKKKIHLASERQEHAPWQSRRALLRKNMGKRLARR
jgi:hypothetical protein